MGGEPFVPGTRRIRHGPVTGRIRTFAAMLGVTLALMVVLPGTAQAGRREPNVGLSDLVTEPPHHRLDDREDPFDLAGMLLTPFLSTWRRDGRP